MPNVSADTREYDAIVAEQSAAEMGRTPTANLEEAGMMAMLVISMRRLAHLSRHAAKVQEAVRITWEFVGDSPAYYKLRKADFERLEQALDAMLAEPYA